jgi:hypothetical protein
MWRSETTIFFSYKTIGQQSFFSFLQHLKRSARAFHPAFLCDHETAVCLPPFPLSFSVEVAGGVT